MLIRPVSSANPPVLAPVLPREARQTDPSDSWAPSGPVAIPPPQPNFPEGAGIDSIASQLHAQFGERMGGQQKCVVGVMCERGWRPTEQQDDVLNICDAIMDAGGLPRLIYQGAGEPAEQLKGIQALALPGGRDIDPAKYGATMGPHMDPKEPDSAFDDFEISALKTAFASGMPLLGHCRGFQLMNVAAGGTMTQDIPSEFHSPPGWGSKYGTVIEHHPNVDLAGRVDATLFIVTEDWARLHGLVGALSSANAAHHQCLDRIGNLFMPVAFALDGVVEGIERKGMPWQAGYQFHAESLRYTDRRYQGLYDQLVNDGARFGRGELRPPAEPVPTTLTQL